MLLDNLEYITIENQTTDFPKHFHETFCISLIHKGIEQIDFKGHSLFSEAGSISITNPYEIHSNPITQCESQLKFDTIYISNDLMKYMLNGKNIRFVNRKINNEKANILFVSLKQALDINNPETIEFYLIQFIEILKSYSQEYEKEYATLNFNSFNRINNYIEDHIYDKFCLDKLSKMANINKFGFSKKFKTSTGMTPMNYILMKKIFSSKKIIVQDSNLTDIAYQYNFTDMAHFSKTFKRYVGLSPKKFQENNTI
ncbi:hypothetical protein GCM10022393_04000 [Aquimarina addita]|uniref:HTH araC/xylS-type domain-containing protein n=1 Tax=Aquimarina addita TaxID=870485 RepID=A0ABP7XA22_9FLAO